MTNHRRFRNWLVGRVLPFVFASTLLVPSNSLADDAAAPMRRPWTTSRVVGSPDPPPPFKVVRAFPNLKFDHPLLLARCPGSDRLFVGEQAGVLYSFAEQAGRQGRALLRPAQGDSRRSTCSRRRRRSRRSTGWRSIPTSRRTASASSATRCGATKPRRAESGGRHARLAVHGHRGRPAADRPGERGDRAHLPARRPQRRRPALRPRRHALHLHRRRRQPQPARPAQHGAGHLRPALVDPADRRGPQGRGQELRRPEGQPVRRHDGGAAGGLGLRLPQSLADELRSPDRRAVRRRRRLGAVGDGPSRREGRQLRLVRDGRAAADQAGARSGRRRSARR